MENKVFPRILDHDGTVSYGGNQAWYDSKAAALGGCGAVAAANSLACLAVFYPGVADKLGIRPHGSGIFQRKAFEEFMSSVYKGVGSAFFFNRPMGIGIWRYTKNVLKYARSRNIYLDSHVCVTTFSAYNRPLHFIRSGLAKSGAVALLASWNSYTVTFRYPNGTATARIKNHFITITGISRDAEGNILLTVSTWGKKGTIPYREIYNSWQGFGAIDTALIFFTPTGTRSSVERQIMRTPLILMKSIANAFIHFER